MPGKVQDVKVRCGDEVDEGTVLFILEAMKMENEIYSPLKGLVKEVNITKSQLVNPDDILMVIE